MGTTNFLCQDKLVLNDTNNFTKQYYNYKVHCKIQGTVKFVCYNKL